MSKISRAKYVVLIAIFFLSFVASAILSFIPAEQACGGVQTTCYVVQTSQYEKTLGINNSYFGLIAFPALLIFSLSHLKNPKKYKKQIIKFGIILGALTALYFLYIQFFVINALCKYCLVVDIGALVSLALIFAWGEK